MACLCPGPWGTNLLYLFDNCILDTEQRELRRERNLVPLQPQVFDLLELLIRNRDRVVTKDDLIAAVWGGRIVSESSLTTRINAARTAIGNSGDEQRLIKTFQRKGVRFVGVVREGEKPANGPAVATPSLAASATPDRSPAERRQLTVVSCELMIADGGRLDPEDFRDVISHYHRRLAELAGRFAGSIGRSGGRIIPVYFGYPSAHEDDAEQAVHFGLALCGQAGRLQPDTALQLQVRLGIATGQVVIGEIDGNSQGYTPLGEAPEIAAQLQGAADPGTLLINSATRRLVGGLFDCREAASSRKPGSADIQRAWLVLGASSLDSRFEALRPTTLTPLVGREEDLDLLLRRWAQAKTGEGRVVLISGEPGIGKSRLIAEFQNRVRTEVHSPLRFFCAQNLRDSALRPIVVQLERTAGFQDGDDPRTKLEKLAQLLVLSSAADEHVGLLAELLSLPGTDRYPVTDLSPQVKREKTFVALLKQLESLAARQPLLLLFEDLHWIDPTSLELLDRVIDLAMHFPMLVLVTFRQEFQPPWIGRSHISAMVLNRLSRREGAALIRGVAGESALSASLIEEIAERTDGIPLFVEEMTRAVLERDGDAPAIELVARTPPRALAVPATLHASLMARLDRLGADAKNVAQVGAAIGREFSHALLAPLMPGQEAALAAALDGLVSSGLLFRQGVPPYATYLFKHALVQDAAYGTLLREPRRALHARIAEALERHFAEMTENQPELLARHCTEAALSERAVEWWTKAGEMASRRSAYVEAVSHYTNAIGQTEHLSESPQLLRRKLRLQLACGQALIAARGHGAPETTAAFTRARELATAIDDPGEQFSVFYGLWASGYIRGAHETMKEMAGILLREIESHPDRPERVVAYRVVGTTYWSGGDYVQARQYFEMAVAVLPDENDRSLTMRFGQDPAVSALMYFSYVLFGLGEIDRARLAAEEGFGRALRSGHKPTIAYGQFLRSAFEAVAAGPKRAAPFARECLAVGREHTLPVWIAIGTFYDGWARYQTDGRQLVLMALQRGLALCYEVGVLNFMNQMVLMQAGVEEYFGQIEEGLDLIGAFQDEAQPIKQHWLDAELQRQRGELLLRRTPPDIVAAELAFHQALTIAKRQQTKTFELRAAVALARLWRERGKSREARDLLAPICTWFTQGLDAEDLKSANALLGELGS